MRNITSAFNWKFVSDMVSICMRKNQENWNDLMFGFPNKLSFRCKKH